jgi:AraC-like DNA-binding protein
MPWEDFTTLLDRAQSALGGPEQLCDAGLQGLTFAKFVSALVSRFTNPRTLYLLGAGWLGPMIFRPTRGAEVFLPDGRYAQTVEILPGYRDSDAFFQYVRGGLSAVPHIFGLPAAEIELFRRPNQATYAIEIPGVSLLKGGEDFDIGAARHMIDELTSAAGEMDILAPNVGAEPPAVDLLDRVNHLIAEVSADREASLAEIASEIGMSERTLKRQLRRRGTSFRELRGRHRRDLALRLLRQGETIENVAHRLGFSEPSAFHRAFKRWTGRTPTDVRARDKTHTSRTQPR